MAKKRTPSTTSVASPKATDPFAPARNVPVQVFRPPKKLSFFKRSWIWYESSFAISMLEPVRTLPPPALAPSPDVGLVLAVGEDPPSYALLERTPCPLDHQTDSRRAPDTFALALFFLFYFAVSTYLPAQIKRIAGRVGYYVYGSESDVLAAE